MLNNKENYSKIEVEQAKSDIKNLVNKKSKVIKINLKKKEDIKAFFEDWYFLEYHFWFILVF